MAYLIVNSTETVFDWPAGEGGVRDVCVGIEGGRRRRYCIYLGAEEAGVGAQGGRREMEGRTRLLLGVVEGARGGGCEEHSRAKEEGSIVNNLSVEYKMIKERGGGGRKRGVMTIVYPPRDENVR